jgi:hypothetical protein
VATGLRLAIALKELLRSLIEIDAAAPDVLVGDADPDVAGAEVAGADEVLLVLLLHAAISSAAVAAATALSPALADTEDNGVPRLFSRDMPWHARDQIGTTRAITGRAYPRKSQICEQKRRR